MKTVEIPRRTNGYTPTKSIDDDSELAIVTAVRLTRAENAALLVAAQHAGKTRSQLIRIAVQEHLHG